MKNAAIQWTAESLAAFVASPRERVPGTKMVYPGVKDPAKLKEVVDYLLSLQ
jgi:cytochrome c